MKTFWANILSVGPLCTRETIEEAARTAGPVQVGPGPWGDRKVGTTIRYELRGDDLYAEIEELPGMDRFARAFAILGRHECGATSLLGVGLTNLSREDMRALGLRGIAEQMHPKGEA